MDLLRNFRYARRYRNWREIVAAAAEGRNAARVQLRRGPVFEAPPEVNPARIVNGVWFRSCYTPRGLEIRKGDVVVDVGANIGVFSVMAARAGARVVAVEPFPDNVEHLRRNLAANDCAGAQVVAGALADANGSARLYLGRKGVVHQLFEKDERGERLEQHIDVPTLTLEELMRRHELERVDLLKLDCEGAEGLILASSPRDLLARVGAISMEFHDHASPLQHDEIVERLQAAGFRTELLWNGRSTTGYLYARR